MDPKAKGIFNSCAALFMRYGLKSLNMDDISRHLGMSKKTLYKYVKDKKDLIANCMSCQHEEEEQGMKAICSKNLNAIDEAFEMMQFIISMLQNLNPVLLFDLERHYPEIKKEVMDSRQEELYESISNNIKKGIKEGYYRSNVNVEIVTKIYMSSVQAMMNAELFPPNEVQLSDIYRELFRYHIRGLASDKGREYLKQKIKQIKK